MRALKPKAEYIVLGAVIAALLLYLALRNPDRVNYRLPRLTAIAEGEISAIEIARAGAAVRLEKKDGRWLIQPQGFLSDPARVKAIVAGIGGLSLAALVSESGNYFPYGLDPDTEIVVKAYQGQRLLREFSVGNAAATYSHTYVKLPNDPRVFHALRSFRGDFERRVDDLRDKTVLTFDQNEISAVEIVSAGETAVFTRNRLPVDIQASEKKVGDQAEPSKGDAAWIMADGNAAKPGELNGIIEQASQLSCEGFIEDRAKEDFREPVFTVRFKGRTDYLLSIFPKEETATAYPAVSSESPHPFLLSSYKAENIMKKPGIATTEPNASR